MTAVERLEARIEARELDKREGYLYGTYISIEPKDAETLLTLARQSVGVEEMVRPIIGIENRTAQEAFDIMCDRILSRLGEKP